MIDFKDCPKDESWLLFDSDGNCEFMADEIKLAYACYQIAKEKPKTKKSVEIIKEVAKECVQ